MQFKSVFQKDIQACRLKLWHVGTYRILTCRPAWLPTSSLEMRSYCWSIYTVRVKAGSISLKGEFRLPVSYTTSWSAIATWTVITLLVALHIILILILWFHDFMAVEDHWLQQQMTNIWACHSSTLNYRHRICLCNFPLFLRYRKKN